MSRPRGLVRDTRCESRTGTHRHSRPPQLIALPSHFLMMRSERELGRLRHEEAILALPAALPLYNYFHGMCSVYFGDSLLLLPCVERVLQLFLFPPISFSTSYKFQCPIIRKLFVTFSARGLNTTQRVRVGSSTNFCSLSEEAQGRFFTTHSRCLNTVRVGPLQPILVV